MINDSRLQAPASPLKPVQGQPVTPAEKTSPQPGPLPSAVGPLSKPDQRLASDHTRLAKVNHSLPLLEPATATPPADWGNVSVADRQASLKALQSLAKQLKAQGRPGIEIWGKLTQAAIDNYKGKQISPQRMSDFVMQDLAVAVVGSDALKHLNSYKNLFFVRNPDPLVQTFLNDWKQMGIPPADGNWDKAGWAGEKLDKHKCADFRPEISDKSENQVFHTLFYHFMAYTTQDAFAIEGGSIVHEFKDEGTSSEDHNAAFAAITTGSALRKMRDGSDPAGALQDWPAMTRAAYGKDGGPEIKAGTASPRAVAMDQTIDKLLNNKGLIWKAENLAIDGMKHVKRAYQYLSDLF